MSRYDAGWGRPGGNREGGWAPRMGQGGARGGEYGGDFRPQGGFGGGGAPRFAADAELDLEAGWESGPVFGPARYGLGPYHHRLRTRQRPDADVQKDVEDALFYDTWVDAEAITVSVTDGIVTLAGELPDHYEVRYATDDAWDVEGVRGVQSELRVNGSKRPPLDEVGRRPG